MHDIIKLLNMILYTVSKVKYVNYGFGLLQYVILDSLTVTNVPLWCRILMEGVWTSVSGNSIGLTCMFHSIFL